MRDFVKSLIAAGITMGLSDRETFVAQVSDLITRYQNDPEEGEKWAERIAAYLEQTRNNINLEGAIRGAMGSSDAPARSDITTLTEAIQELTKQMKQSPKSPGQL